MDICICNSIFAAVIAISKIPLKFIVKGLKAIVILIVISAAFNLFLTPGTKHLSRYGS